MNTLRFALQLLAGMMIVIPFITAMGIALIDHWYKRKLENDEKWCEMTGVWKGMELRKKDADD